MINKFRSYFVMVSLILNPVANAKCDYSVLKFADHYILYIETLATHFAISFETEFNLDDFLDNNESQISQQFETPMGSAGHAVVFRKSLNKNKYVVKSINMSLPYIASARFVNCDYNFDSNNRRRRR